ncbi:proline--tRNA ligase [Frankia sp. Cppng1_Ct_nod]|uniref:proline--tRNA ligase n=1 Tax=Frankia sp. Cppng1_Ct_nod TaxID=2897162 RepID=UPI00104169EF|nr:proline--tRNA ligase [Frankia sp. Cppng1_Ct_nod]
MAILSPRGEDFPRWYQDVLAKAELADNGPVRGTMVIRPYGYAIWERMQADVDARIKATGAVNAYFPLFIPESYLRREAQHIEGFSPELAVVTHGGGKELEEPVVVRPTSETVIGEYMSKWTQSYRDLPLLLNQWANVVRWELRPRLFLRTSEFLWQEGHTAHVDEADAAAYARRIHLEVYLEFMTSVLALPVFVGRKTTKERFAGATNTLTLEAMMGDGKALQMATSHELGQNFARAFNIDFLGADGLRHLAWTTSWGSSTRMIGGLIMAHGDDNGLRIPPRLAPTQVVALPVRDDATLIEQISRIAQGLRAVGVRCDVDARPGLSFGRRVTDAELKGIPLRIELGPRDLAAGNVTLARRDTSEKIVVPLDDVLTTVPALLDDVQKAMYTAALADRDARTRDVSSLQDAVEATAVGFARLPWAAVGDSGEARLAEESLTVRCIQRPDGTIPENEDEPDLICIVARSY